MGRERQPRTYLAAPVAVLGRPDWPHRVRQIRTSVGQVWDPAQLFTCSADWLRRWPRLLPLVSGLVLVPDDDGDIGAGCLREIADVLGKDLQAWLYADGELVPWGDISLRPVPNPSRFFVVTVSQVKGAMTHRRRLRGWLAPAFSGPDRRIPIPVLGVISELFISMEPPGCKNRKSRAGGDLGRVIRPYPKDQPVGTLGK